MDGPGDASLSLRLAGAVGGARLLLGGKCQTAGAVVLAYHDIGDEPGGSDGYSVSATNFRRHLLMVQRAGVRFVPLAQLTRSLLDGDPVDGLASVVFDDALAGVHHHALPILAELRVPATVFVVTEELGSAPPWWPGSGRTMTEAELGEAVAGGVQVAAHTRHHPSLVQLARNELVDEVGGSRAQLQDLAGSAVDVFAYPFGHHNSEVRDAVAAAGFDAAYTFLNGRLLPGLDPFRLPRFTMSSRHNGPRLAYHLARSSSSWPNHQLDQVGPAPSPR